MVEKSAWTEILRQKLPGEKGHRHMAPTFRGEPIAEKEAMEAAVLALLYPSEGRTHLVFIKRNEYDGPHSAQVSFPGGAREAEDRSLEETALRETYEELGIQDPIEVLGALSPLHIPVSNFMVYPFVGWMDARPEFRPDRSEVQYVIEAALSDLQDPSNRDSETLYRHEQRIVAPFYRVGNDKIWGATAMILSEFLLLATTVQ